MIILRRQVIFPILAILLLALSFLLPWQFQAIFNTSHTLIYYWYIISDVADIILIALWAAFSRSLYPLLLFLGATILSQIIVIIRQFGDKSHEIGWQLSLIALTSFVLISVTVLLTVRVMRDSRQKTRYQQRLLQAAIDVLPLRIGVHRRDGFQLASNETTELPLDPAVSKLQNENFIKFLWQSINKKGEVAELRGKLYQHKFSTFNEQTLYQIGYGLLDIPRRNPKNSADDHLMVYALDVTEREQMMRELLQLKEEAEVANRAKTHFLANVSHELRTPLTAIVGFSQFMAMHNDIDADMREMIDTITRNGENLLALVNDVLDLSKAESNTLNFDEVIFEPTALLREEINLIRPQLEAKGLVLHSKISADIPNYILSDAAKVRQVVRNLLSNAEKFTAQGGIEVRMWSSDLVIWHKQLRPQPSEFSSQTLERLYAKSIQHIPEQSHRIVIHVEIVDSGQGIAAEKLATIFEAFSQARSGIIGQESTGLGLAISKKFAKFLSGDLLLLSQPNVGTSCHFHFLAERSEDD